MSTNSKWPSPLLIVLLVVASGLSFVIGDSMGQRAIRSKIALQIDSVQGSLAFNRILDERKLKKLLELGCINQASFAIDVSLDKDMELLSEFVKNDQLDEQAMKYIADRDSDIIGLLKTYKSKYGKSWVEPPCEGNKN
jgi:hypothetical protein